MVFTDARTAATLSEVAWLEGTLGQSSEAEQHHLRAIRILEQQTGGALALCIALNGLSTFYVESGGRYAQAEQLSRRALAIGIGLFGPRAPELVSLLSNLATVRSIRGDKAEALLLFENALELLVDAAPAYPETSHDMWAGAANGRNSKGLGQLEGKEEIRKSGKYTLRGAREAYRGGLAAIRDTGATASSSGGQSMQSRVADGRS